MSNECPKCGAPAYRIESRIYDDGIDNRGIQHIDIKQTCTKCLESWWK